MTPELDDTVQGLRVRLYADPPSVRVGLSPAGLAIDTCDPDRLDRMAALLTDAADRLRRARQLQEQDHEQPTLFGEAT